MGNLEFPAKLEKMQTPHRPRPDGGVKLTTFVLRGYSANRISRTTSCHSHLMAAQACTNLDGIRSARMLQVFILLYQQIFFVCLQ